MISIKINKIFRLFVNSRGEQKKGSVLMILENRKKKRPCVNGRGDKARIFYYDIYACNCTELLCFDDYVLQAYNLSIPDFKFQSYLSVNNFITL